MTWDTPSSSQYMQQKGSALKFNWRLLRSDKR